MGKIAECLRRDVPAFCGKCGSELIDWGLGNDCPMGCVLEIGATQKLSVRNAGPYVPMSHADAPKDTDSGYSVKT